MAIEIVDFPIKNGDFPLQNVSGRWIRYLHGRCWSFPPPLLRWIPNLRKPRVSPAPPSIEDPRSATWQGDSDEVRVILVTGSELWASYSNECHAPECEIPPKLVPKNWSPNKNRKRTQKRGFELGYSMGCRIVYLGEGIATWNLTNGIPNMRD